MFASTLIELFDFGRLAWNNHFTDEDPLVTIERKGQYNGEIVFENHDGCDVMRVGFVDGTPAILSYGSIRQQAGDPSA